MPPKTPIIRGQLVTSEKAIHAQEPRRALTPAERKLWERLRAGRLDGWHFRRQQVIEPYIVDFYCHQAALVVELDGEIHRYQPDYDQAPSKHWRRSGCGCCASAIPRSTRTSGRCWQPSCRPAARQLLLPR